MDVARQEDDGVWGVLKSRRIDWDSRTLTCTTSHFSDYSMVEGMQIRPAAASIGTLGTVNLKVTYCVQQTISGDPDLVALVYSCGDDDLAPLGTFTNWSVNGTAGGNSSIGTVVKTSPAGGQARYTAPPAAPPNNPVAVSVKAKGRRGTQLLVSNITIGGLWYGTVTIQQGGASSQATVIWTQYASYQGLEAYRPSGTVHYTPETDYGPSCTFVSMAPTDADIDPALGVLFIDWTNSPAKAYGYGAMSVQATTCFTCEGWDQPDCSSDTLPGWFAADSLAVSATGDRIQWSYTDYGQLPAVSTTIDFTKGLPPLSFTMRR